MTVAPPFGKSGSEDFDFLCFVVRRIVKVFLNHGVGVKTTCESQCGQFQTLPISCGKNSYFPPHDQHLLFSYSIKGLIPSIETIFRHSVSLRGKFISVNPRSSTAFEKQKRRGRSPALKSVGEN